MLVENDTKAKIQNFDIDNRFSIFWVVNSELKQLQFAAEEIRLQAIQEIEK